MIARCKDVVSWLGVSACLLTVALPARPAQAFCGFYVTGADTSLYANATMVVLMRDGTRTVLSMQNNYQGPPEDFALVIPVPTVLQKEQVNTLPKDVFEHVDTLAAPRLVEYWEADPCQVLTQSTKSGRGPVLNAAGAADAGASVTVEAKFAVGEYDIVILSANDASGLESWLTSNQYNIPAGASEVLKPYVAEGTKFFVAKVDSKRVTFEAGQAVLSPLRFHYDSSDFKLPVRLGLLNSQGTQDLIVSILARERYEVANHPNVTIPTNIRVLDEVRDSFAGFYEALFSKTVEKAAPQAVVTEYAWNANSCDPCPTPALTQADLATLGADVTAGADNPRAIPDYVLTRLHYRYTQDTLGEDLVFKAAPAIVGGRGVPDAKGNLEDTSVGSASFNNFQGRYVILHPWEKALTCQNPVRGSWGGPDNGATPVMPQRLTNTALIGAPAKAAELPALLAESVSELGVNALHPLDPLVAPTAVGGAAAKAGAGGDAAKGGSGGAGGAQNNAGGATASPDAGAEQEAAAEGCSCSIPGAGDGGTIPPGGLGFGMALALAAARRMRRRS